MIELIKRLILLSLILPTVLTLLALAVIVVIYIGSFDLIGAAAFFGLAVGFSLVAAIVIGVTMSVLGIEMDEDIAD